ncbi:hypothetical protein [Flavobacterium cheniae]|uniref:Uncharacterized protein n=1 Tax=Flavobacterium cheniae TaxID=295428 RepID=A0A562KBV2_9FLAO|nr:hypothetical protein [Flavobacterium cheniae]TDR18631.1 hypothetical protein C8D80_2517 [Flavobacterium cheniae]TWH92887.1 hypothetical protein IP97_02208 [Flavobacterium cheniae]
MKKIILISVLAFFVSCKNENHTTQIETKVDFTEILNSEELLKTGKSISDPIEKYNFYQHLFFVNQLETFEKNEDQQFDFLKKYPKTVIQDLTKIVVSDYTKKITEKDLDKKVEYEDLTLRQKISTLDSLLVKNDEQFENKLYELFVGTLMGGTTIETIENNIATIYSDFGSAASIKRKYILIEDNKLTDLGNGYDKLSKIEFENLEKIIKTKVKNYMWISGRSGTEFIRKPNGNFIIKFNILADEDSEASGGSYNVSYETKDLKTFLPSSVKVEKINN